MDTFTQAAAGALVGEAIVGSRIGRRGAIWGAVLATIPDLDVIANPLLETTEALVFHRGPSHSFLLLTLLGCGAGFLLHRLYRDRFPDVGRWRWIAMATFAFFSQPGLDVLTSYGTRILWPISERGYEFASISIIDPIFTLTIVIGLSVSMLSETDTDRRRRTSRITLGLAGAYLVLCVGLKSHATRIFHEELDRQQIRHDALETEPSLFTNLMWIGKADSGDHFLVGLYSIFDNDTEVTFERVDKNRELLEPYRDDPRVQTLVSFTRGFYSVRESETGLIFEDLHIGRSDQWLSDEGDAVFRFELVVEEEPDPHLVEVRELPEGNDASTELVRRYLRRVFGDESTVSRSGSENSHLRGVTFSAAIWAVLTT